MKILYSIQGTGNGHVSRAKEIIPYLKHYGEVDLFLSGNNTNVNLDYPIKYKSKGVSFYYNKNGGIDYVETIKNLRLAGVLKEVLDFPIRNYDLVINDFEFISAWAAWYRNIPTVSLGHQASFISSKVPRPAKQDFIGELILKKYAPSSHAIGFHFEEYDDFIYKPVIRKDIRRIEPTFNGHYTVYLPSFGDTILIKILQQIKEIEWQVFSKYAEKPSVFNNVKIYPAENNAFVKSMSESNGLLTNAGFEAPAEALFLGKKVFVIPIKNQYEQACNAAAIEKLGVPVSENLDEKNIQKIRNWVNDDTVPKVYFPDDTSNIIEKVVTNYDYYLMSMLA